MLMGADEVFPIGAGGILGGEGSLLFAWWERMLMRSLIWFKK